MHKIVTSQFKPGTFLQAGKKKKEEQKDRSKQRYLSRYYANGDPLLSFSYAGDPSVEDREASLWSSPLSHDAAAFESSSVTHDSNHF